MNGFYTTDLLLAAEAQSPRRRFSFRFNKHGSS